MELTLNNNVRTVSEISRTELANILNMTGEGLRKLASRLGINEKFRKGMGRGGKTAFYDINSFPADYQKKIKDLRAVQNKAISYAEMPGWQKEMTENKFQIIAELRKQLSEPENRYISKEKILQKFVTSYNAGEILPATKKNIGSLSVRTLKRWISQEIKYRKTNNLAEFAPQYGKRKGQTKLNEKEKAFFVKNYFHPNRLNILTLYEDYQKICRENRIKPVCYGTVCNFLKSIPLPVHIAGRVDKKNAKYLYQPYITRDRNSLNRGDIYASDGHTLNFFVWDPSRRRYYRPTLVVWRDVNTNMVVGFSIAETENTDVIIDAFAHAVENFGVPRAVYIDNGSGYKNKATKGFVLNDDDKTRLKGIYAMVGVEYDQHSIPFNPKSKTIEPFWNVVNDKFSRRFITYCGRIQEERKESLKEILKSDDTTYITLDYVYEKFAEFVKFYNEERISQADGMKGLTPRQKWDEQSNPIRHISSKELPLALSTRKELTVQQNGVQFNNEWYCDPDMVLTTKYFKQKVVVGIDRHDLSHVWIFSSDNQLICEAFRQKRGVFSVGPSPETTADIRKNQRDIRKQKKLMKEARTIQEHLADKANTVYFNDYVRPQIEVKQIENAAGESGLKGLYE